jgi:hypothetical protein
MNTLSIHLFPHELIGYKRVVEHLNLSFFNIPINDVKVDVCLNMNPDIIECKKQHATQIIDEFMYITETLNVRRDININKKPNFLGVNEHRRYTINTSLDTDTIIYLDCDLHFNIKLLGLMIRYSTHLLSQNKMFILTPQCVRLWDSSWDCLVNKYFVKNQLGFYKNINPVKIAKKTYGDVSLNKSKQFKWAGGWFTGMSAKLAKLIGIPRRFKGYGPDDTFMMKCCELLNKNKYDVEQYIISGMVVCEDTQSSKNETMFKENIIDFRMECNKHFQNEVDIFSKKL